MCDVFFITIEKQLMLRPALGPVSGKICYTSPSTILFLKVDPMFRHFKRLPPILARTKLKLKSKLTKRPVGLCLTHPRR